MTCTDALLQIDALIDGELHDRRELDAHLAACESCAREVDSRRALSDRLRQDLTAALGGIQPAPGEKERVVLRLMASRPAGFTLFIRAAAVVVIGVSIGFIAMLGRGRGVDPAYVAKAAVPIAEVEKLQRAIPAKQEIVLKNYGEAVRSMPRNHGTGPAGELLSAYLVGIGEPLAMEVEVNVQWEAGRPDQFVMLIDKNMPRALYELARLPRERLELFEKQTLPPAFDYVIKMGTAAPGEVVIDIVQKNNDRTVRVLQYENAKIVVHVDGKEYQAANVGELLRDKPAICREIGITGRDGAISVGNVKSTAAVRSATRYTRTAPQWVEFEPEAEAAFTTVYLAKKKSADEAKKTAQAVLARARAAATMRVEVEPVRVEDVLVRLRTLDRAEIELEVADAEKRIVGLRKKLAELEDLEARVNSIKACVEALRSLDK